VTWGSYFKLNEQKFYSLFIRSPRSHQKLISFLNLLRPFDSQRKAASTPGPVVIQLSLDPNQGSAAAAGSNHRVSGRGIFHQRLRRFDGQRQGQAFTADASACLSVSSLLFSARRRYTFVLVNLRQQPTASTSFDSFFRQLVN
jgi:hypothetical protein